MSLYDTRVEARSLLIARLGDEDGNKGKQVVFSERKNTKPVVGMSEPQLLLIASIDGQEVGHQVFVPLATNSDGILNPITL